MSEVKSDMRQVKHMTFAMQDGDHDTGVVYTSPSGELLRANPTILHWHGRTQDEIKGHGWINTVHEDDRKRVMERWSESVQMETDSYIAFRLVSVDGEVIEVEARNLIMKDKEGVHGWLSFIKKKENC
jgi:PAS domain S-box-containing protein